MLRAFFIWLSENRKLREVAENSAAGKRASSRFVAGTDVPAAVEVAQTLNSAGMAVTLDNLGENVTNADEARHSAALYHQMLDQIASQGIRGNVSLKLTHMGFDVDENLATSIVRDLVAHAARLNNFVRVDMEGSPYTQRTLDLVKTIHAEPGYSNAVGAVIQAYLKRSESDIEELCSKGIRVRLCKGAYKEPADIAIQEKSGVDQNFNKLTRILLKSGIFHGIATHDPAIIEETIRFARAEKIPPEAFEFQMLYGIRRDLQEQLVRDGWGLRIYVAFGTEWYPYFMRRLAERPANVLFIAKNFFRR